MDYNASLWSYYPPNDQKFVHPLYAPYVKQIIPNGDGGYCEVNKWSQKEHSGCYFSELDRKGWGTTFQLMHPTDPCPEGYTKVENGYCVQNQHEFEGTFYTDEAFVPKYQYWDGYTTRSDCSKQEISEFDMKSINPHTGNFVIYHNPTPNKNTHKYGTLASKDSLLA